METFFRALGSPGTWTEAQWLAFVILLFILVAIVFFSWRLYRIIRTMGKSTYKPNIGLHRTGHRLGRIERRDEGDESGQD